MLQLENDALKEKLVNDEFKDAFWEIKEMLNFRSSCQGDKLNLLDELAFFWEVIWFYLLFTGIDLP